MRLNIYCWGCFAYICTRWMNAVYSTTVTRGRCAHAVEPNAVLVLFRQKRELSQRSQTRTMIIIICARNIRHTRDPSIHVRLMRCLCLVMEYEDSANIFISLPLFRFPFSLRSVVAEVAAVDTCASAVCLLSMWRVASATRIDNKFIYLCANNFRVIFFSCTHFHWLFRLDAMKEMRKICCDCDVGGTGFRKDEKIATNRW